MKTIDWQDTGFDLGEEAESSFTSNPQTKEKMSEENDKQAYQLRRYRDPLTDVQRQEILILTEYFGTLLSKNYVEHIAIDLLLDDFEAFVFSSTTRASVQHYTKRQGFMDLWKGTRIIERHVRSTDVDSDKSTAWQICEYKIIYDGDNDPVVEVACEIFTVKDKRIAKYRAWFGCAVPDMDDFGRFLALSRKDKMLAKVKKINFALAGQPDLEKIASLFNENTEYRIWRWHDHKCFTLAKTDFSSGFESIQDEMCITSIVPYDVSVDTQQKFISGQYVYHLQERSSGNKFIWLSTCIYTFDQDINLTKVSQQGDLNPEEESSIPFELSSREILVKRADDFLQSYAEDYDAFYNDLALYDCRYYSFMPLSFPNPGFHQGLKHMDSLQFMMESTKNFKFDFSSMVDTFVDHSHESYDVVVLVDYVEVRDINKNTQETFITPSIFYFENGKVAKELDFISDFSCTIPSPFDDKTFKAKSIIT